MEQAYEIWNWNFKANLSHVLETRVQIPKNPIWPPGGHFKVTLLKINRLLPIHASEAPAKFKLHIQNQNIARVRKPTNTIWLPGGQFKSDVTDNKQASAHSHKQHAFKICNWSAKANLSNVPETMSPTESRYRKIQYGHQAAILKVALLKINMLLPIHISDVPYEIWNWSSKANLSYAPETMSSRDRRTGGQTDRPTDGKGDSNIPRPHTHLRWAGV